MLLLRLRRYSTVCGFAPNFLDLKMESQIVNNFVTRKKHVVAAIVGCYTSASRKAVLPELNQMRGLLLYYPTCRLAYQS